METPIPASRQRGACIAKLGAWLQLAQVLGVVGMMRAMNTLSTHDTSDPVALTAAIRDVFGFAACGIGLSLLGVVLVTIAITACAYRAAWMWRFLCAYGLIVIGLNVCMLVTGRSGAVILLPAAVFFLMFAIAKRNEFVRASQHRPLPACYSLDE